jgi:hypothetical protein
VSNGTRRRRKTYIDRLRCDPERWAEFVAKRDAYSKTYVVNLSEAGYAYMLRRRAAAQRARRAKKRVETHD